MLGWFNTTILHGPVQEYVGLVQYYHTAWTSARVCWVGSILPYCMDPVQEYLTCWVGSILPYCMDQSKSMLGWFNTTILHGSVQEYLTCWVGSILPYCMDHDKMQYHKHVLKSDWSVRSVVLIS